MATKPSMGDKQYNDLNKSYRERYGEYKRDLLLWEQSEELKKNNQLAEQRLRDEREREEQRRQDALRQERLAEQYEREREERRRQDTLMQQQFELNKIQKELELQENDYQNQMDLEEKRQSHEERMRYYKLCDDMDLNYDDIEKLTMWITRPTKEQWDELIAIDNQYQAIFNTKELEDLYAKNSEVMDKFLNERYEIEEKIDVLKEEMDDYSDYISLTGMTNLLGGSEETLKKYIATNEKTIGTYNVLILLVTIIALTVAVLVEDASIVALVLGGLLDLTFFVSQDKYKKGIDIMKKAIEEHNEKKSKNEKELSDLQNRLSNFISETDNIENEINNYKATREEELKDDKEFTEISDKRNYLMSQLRGNLDGDHTINGQEFYEFRLNHYNEEIERLFRKLGIDILRKIDKSDIKKSGTVEDYRDFIEDKVLKMDKLYFDDYNAYLDLQL